MPKKAVPVGEQGPLFGLVMEKLELSDEFPADVRCPQLAVFTHIPLVAAVEGAPLHGEARVDRLVVVANVVAAGVFGRLFAGAVGVAFGAVVL